MSHTLVLFFQAATMKSQLCDWSVEMSSINSVMKTTTSSEKLQQLSCFIQFVSCSKPKYKNGNLWFVCSLD